jgi:hypothetical protein
MAPSYRRAFILSLSPPIISKKNLHLVASFSKTDYNANVVTLETTHSVFLHWHSQVRSNVLFTEINLVLKRFMDPFLRLFRRAASILPSAPSAAHPDHHCARPAAPP